jgi:hypothetical protein
MTQHFTATFRDGQLVPDEPVCLSEGQKVVFAFATDLESVKSLDLEEAGWDDPAAIQARLARFDAMEPIQMSDAEIAEWEAARAEVRKVTLEAVRKEMELP